MMTNGSFAEVVDVVLDQRKAIKAIIVHFINPDAGKESRKGQEDFVRKYGKPVNVIERCEKQFSLDKRGTSAATATAYQFPIKLATAVTSHKVQGQTIKPPQSIVMDIQNVKNDSQVYVMISRAQKLDQLFILDDLYLRKWKTSPSAFQELKRLEETALNTDGIGTFDVACLNVRSLRKHFEDIKVLMNFDLKVICLQETWLELHESSNEYTLSNFNVCLNSQGRGKGIASYFDSSYNCTINICEKDVQITKVSSREIDIVNVYRSSSNSTLAERFTTLLDVDRPTLVCGDMNCDVSTEKPSFLKTLNDLGFVKINQQPTHDMGRSIDSIFVNSFLHGSVTIKQFGVGFSDHDCILIKIN